MRHRAWLAAIAAIPLVGCLSAASLRAADGEPTREQLDFFERKIRPVLVDRCYECHSAKAKELQSAMTAKKLEAYAIRDSSAEGRYAAVMLVPNVQLLVVSAQYELPSDIEYRLYHKDYAAAYSDLRSSLLAKGRFFF